MRYPRADGYIAALVSGQNWPWKKSGQRCLALRTGYITLDNYLRSKRSEQVILGQSPFFTAARCLETPPARSKHWMRFESVEIQSSKEIMLHNICLFWHLESGYLYFLLGHSLQNLLQLIATIGTTMWILCSTMCSPQPCNPIRQQNDQTKLYL